MKRRFSELMFRELWTACGNEFSILTSDEHPSFYESNRNTRLKLEDPTIATHSSKPVSHITDNTRSTCDTKQNILTNTVIGNEWNAKTPTKNENNTSTCNNSKTDQTPTTRVQSTSQTTTTQPRPKPKPKVHTPMDPVLDIIETEFIFNGYNPSKMSLDVVSHFRYCNTNTDNNLCLNWICRSSIPKRIKNLKKSLTAVEEHLSVIENLHSKINSSDVSELTKNMDKYAELQNYYKTTIKKLHLFSVHLQEIFLRYNTYEVWVDSKFKHIYDHVKTNTDDIYDGIHESVRVDTVLLCVALVSYFESTSDMLGVIAGMNSKLPFVHQQEGIINLFWAILRPIFMTGKGMMFMDSMGTGKTFQSLFSSYMHFFLFGWISAVNLVQDFDYTGSHFYSNVDHQLSEQDICNKFKVWHSNMFTKYDVDQSKPRSFRMDPLIKPMRLTKDAHLQSKNPNSNIDVNEEEEEEDYEPPDYEKDDFKGKNNNGNRIEENPVRNHMLEDLRSAVESLKTSSKNHSGLTSDKIPDNTLQQIDTSSLGLQTLGDDSHISRFTTGEEDFKEENDDPDEEYDRKKDKQKEEETEERLRLSMPSTDTEDDNKTYHQVIGIQEVNSNTDHNSDNRDKIDQQMFEEYFGPGLNHDAFVNFDKKIEDILKLRNVSCGSASKYFFKFMDFRSLSRNFEGSSAVFSEKVKSYILFKMEIANFPPYTLMLYKNLLNKEIRIWDVYFSPNSVMASNVPPLIVTPAQSINTWLEELYNSFDSLSVAIVCINTRKKPRPSSNVLPTNIEHIFTTNTNSSSSSSSNTTQSGSLPKWETYNERLKYSYAENLKFFDNYKIDYSLVHMEGVIKEAKAVTVFAETLFQLCSEVLTGNSIRFNAGLQSLIIKMITLFTFVHDMRNVKDIKSRMENQIKILKDGGYSKSVSRRRNFANFIIKGCNNYIETYGHCGYILNIMLKTYPTDLQTCLRLCREHTAKLTTEKILKSILEKVTKFHTDFKVNAPSFTLYMINPNYQLIIDEAHKLNKHTKAIWKSVVLLPTSAKILLSGTPLNNKKKEETGTLIRTFTEYGPFKRTLDISQVDIFQSESENLLTALRSTISARRKTVPPKLINGMFDKMRSTKDENLLKLRSTVTSYNDESNEQTNSQDEELFSENANFSDKWKDLRYFIKEDKYLSENIIDLIYQHYPKSVYRPNYPLSFNGDRLQVIAPDTKPKLDIMFNRLSSDDIFTECRANRCHVKKKSVSIEELKKSKTFNLQKISAILKANGYPYVNASKGITYLGEPKTGDENTTQVPFEQRTMVQIPDLEDILNSNIRNEIIDVIGRRIDMRKPWNISGIAMHLLFSYNYHRVKCNFCGQVSRPCNEYQRMYGQEVGIPEEYVTDDSVVDVTHTTKSQSKNTSALVPKTNTNWSVTDIREANFNKVSVVHQHISNFRMGLFHTTSLFKGFIFDQVKVPPSALANLNKQKLSRKVKKMKQNTLFNKAIESYTQNCISSIKSLNSIHQCRIDNTTSILCDCYSTNQSKVRESKKKISEALNVTEFDDEETSFLLFMINYTGQIHQKIIGGCIQHNPMMLYSDYIMSNKTKSALGTLDLISVCINGFNYRTSMLYKTVQSAVILYIKYKKSQTDQKFTRQTFNMKEFQTWYFNQSGEAFVSMNDHIEFNNNVPFLDRIFDSMDSEVNRMDISNNNRHNNEQQTRSQSTKMHENNRNAPINLDSDTEILDEIEDSDNDKEPQDNKSESTTNSKNENGDDNKEPSGIALIDEELQVVDFITTALCQSLLKNPTHFQNVPMYKSIPIKFFWGRETAKPRIFTCPMSPEELTVYKYYNSKGLTSDAVQKLQKISSDVHYIPSDTELKKLNHLLFPIIGNLIYVVANYLAKIPVTMYATGTNTNSDTPKQQLKNKVSVTNENGVIDQKSLECERELMEMVNRFKFKGNYLLDEESGLYDVSKLPSKYLILLWYLINETNILSPKALAKNHTNKKENTKKKKKKNTKKKGKKKSKNKDNDFEDSSSNEEDTDDDDANDGALETELDMEIDSVIVFTRGVEYLDHLAETIKKYLGLDVSIYAASKTKRHARKEEELQNFRKGVTRVILMSLNSGKESLNIKEGNHAIIMDPWWNPHAEEQAKNRINRLNSERKDLKYAIFSIKGAIDDIITGKANEKTTFASGIFKGASGINRADSSKPVHITFSRDKLSSLVPVPQNHRDNKGNSSKKKSKKQNSNKEVESDTNEKILDNIKKFNLHSVANYGNQGQSNNNMNNNDVPSVGSNNIQGNNMEGFINKNVASKAKDNSISNLLLYLKSSKVFDT